MADVCTQPDKKKNNKRMCLHTNSLNFAAVGGFLEVLMKLDDPLLIFLLLNSSNLLQLAGPLVFQNLLNSNQVKH